MPSSAPPPPHLHPSPTRRSSDLAAVISGSAAFFAPEIAIVPLSLLPPVMRMRSMLPPSKLRQDTLMPARTALQNLVFQAIDQRPPRSEEHTSELQSRRDLVCRLLHPPPLTYTLPLHDALPISPRSSAAAPRFSHRKSQSCR